MGNGKKILLLNPPSKILCLRDYYCAETAKADYIWPPLDLLVISGILSKNHELTVIDAVAEKLDHRKCRDRIEMADPDWIISLVAGFRIKQDMEFLQHIRGESKAKILLSGDVPYFTRHHFMQRYSWIDGIITNFVCPDLDKYISEGGDTPCVFTLRTCSSKSGVNSNNQNAFEYPVPHHELFPLDKYHLAVLAPAGNPISCVISNYGCPFRCEYCSYPGVKYAERPIENFLEEWNYCMHLKVAGVFLRDLTLGVSRKRIHELCKGLIDIHNTIPWLCEAKLDLLDQETLNIMLEAKCVCICFGLESLNGDLLKQYLRESDLEKTRELSQYCKDIGIKTLAHYIVDLPGNSIYHSIINILKISRFPLDFISWNRYVPRYGSKMRKTLEMENPLRTDSFDLDVSGGDNFFQLLLIFASLVFYGHPARAWNLFQLLHFKGLASHLGFLWKKILHQP